ncbi:MAG: dihydrofolate reductase family protein [Glaciihabitans sp.]
MIVRPAIPAGGQPIELDTEEGKARLVELYTPPRRHWVRLNLIASVSGSASGSDGTSETLTNPTDRAILRVIRDLSDVVVVGAASVRAEGYVIPRHAALAVVTATGDFSGHQIRSGKDRGALLVVCPPSAAQRAEESLGDTPHIIIPVSSAGSQLDPADIVRSLRNAGYHSVVCEGGPSLAAQFVRAGILDEFCLTVAPVLNGAALPLFGGHGFSELRLRLSQLLVDDADFLYSRWLPEEPAATGR